MAAIERARETPTELDSLESPFGRRGSLPQESSFADPSLPLRHNIKGTGGGCMHVNESKVNPNTFARGLKEAGGCKAREIVQPFLGFFGGGFGGNFQGELG